MTRFDHEIFIILGVIVGELLGTQYLILPDTNILVLSLLSPVLIGMASFAFNDLMDLETDIHNKRKDRPLVTGHISKTTAWAITIIGFIFGPVLAYYINVTVFKIAIAYVILAFFYSIWLKNVAVVGNAVIASTMAIPFIFGNYVVMARMYDPVIILTAMAFLMGLGREIFKSIQDMSGDKKTGRQTLPVLIGPKVSAAFGAYFIIFSVFVSFLPFVYIPAFQFDPYYLIPILAADILLLYSVYYGVKLEKFNKVRKWTLLSMLFGLLGFLLGAVF